MQTFVIGLSLRKYVKSFISAKVLNVSIYLEKTNIGRLV